MRILLLGDTHGSVDHIRFAVKKAIAQDCEQIIQLGDFGYFPGTPETDKFLEEISSPKIPIYFIDGNHDNHWMLNHKAENPVEICSGVFYLPRGYRWNIGIWTLAALGGAYSIDRQRRTLGIDFWEEEVISYSDVARTLRGGDIDILLCHDHPAKVPLTTIKGNGIRINREAMRNSETLQAVVEACNVRSVFHGHHHKFYETTIDGVRYCGLDCNHRPERSWIVLEL